MKKVIAIICAVIIIAVACLLFYSQRDREVISDVPPTDSVAENSAAADAETGAEVRRIDFNYSLLGVSDSGDVLCYDDQHELDTPETAEDEHPDRIVKVYNIETGEETEICSITYPLYPRCGTIDDSTITFCTASAYDDSGEIAEVYTYNRRTGETTRSESVTQPTGSSGNTYASQNYLVWLSQTDPAAKFYDTLCVANLADIKD